MLHRACLAALVLASPCLAADHAVFPGQSIQAAIDAAVDGDRVLVQSGTYVESIDLKGKAIELVGVGGAASTFLIGVQSIAAIRLLQGEGPGTWIRGFTITGDSQTGYGSAIDGIPLFGSGPNSTARIEDCVVRGSSNYGGSAVAGDFAMLRCTISENAGIAPANPFAHGGVFGAPTMIQCAVLANTTTGVQGGGVSIVGTKPAYLEDCLIAGNRGVTQGGGVYVGSGSMATISRCVIVGNQLHAGCSGDCVPPPYSTYGSGICAAPTASVLVESSTIADNQSDSTSTAPVPVGGLSGPMTVHDSIVRGNAGTEVDAAALTYCDVGGGAPGAGNFDADPLFVFAAGGDDHLKSGSPCIDAGTPGLTDPDGSPLDVGAHPFATFYARRDVDAVDRTPGWSSLSAEVGGQHVWRVHVGPAAAGRLYLVLGSATGTAPATPLLGAALPLAFDGWFATTLLHPNTGPLFDTLGVLNAAGAADAKLFVPPATVIGPATVWHAALVLDPLTFTATASQAVELEIQ